MPVTVSYPGVYIQELPSGVHTITGVATSIGAFVDTFVSGPLNKPVQVLSFAAFEAQFGGLAPGSEASYAIQQFFLNGGSEAYVVRVTSVGGGAPATPAQIALEDKPGGSILLTASADGPGSWGANLRIDVDYGTSDPTSQFNLTVTEIAVSGATTTVIAKEVYRNLIIDAAQSNDAATTVNAASQLITVATTGSGGSGQRPAQTGTASAAIASFPGLGIVNTDAITVSLNGTSLGATGPLSATAGNPGDLNSLAAALQAQIRGLTGNPLPNAVVSVVGSPSGTAYLMAKTGTGKAQDILSFSDAAAGGLASKLGFTNASSNVQQYALGGAAGGAQALPTGATGSVTGADGSWNPNQIPAQWSSTAGIAAGIIGDPVAKTGLYSLMNVDLFNILCVPATMNLGDNDTFAVATAAISLCEIKRAMYLLDAPQAAASRDTVSSIMSWLDGAAGLRSANAALYFPRMDIADPLNQQRLRSVSPSGTVAGLWARTDGARGVWKAPAGTAATLTGVQKLEYALTDPENGVLNPLAINCLRNFPIYGPVCWGARTLNGSDQQADQWKYIPVRRLALYIEESLYRGTQWVVFEPNDTPLWAQIRLNVGAFMQTLFRQGAFQGSTPQQAYFVVCDATTNPQASINQGIVNIVVGFAPLLPAEFVIISIQQMAGQLST